jgi:hypothetical protein
LGVFEGDCHGAGLSHSRQKFAQATPYKG